MTKAIAVFLALVMAVQIIRPLGLPGLKRRADAWKLAVLAFAAMILIAAVRPN